MKSEHLTFIIFNMGFIFFAVVFTEGKCDLVIKREKTTVFNGPPYLKNRPCYN